MKRPNLFGILLLGGILALLSRPAHAATALTSCQVITKSGNYILANNVSGTGFCFSIRTGNVTFNGNGKTITTPTGDALEVSDYSESGAGYSNVTVSNFKSAGGVRTFGDHISHVTFQNLHVAGITVYGSDDVTIKNNIIGAGGLQISNADRDGWAPRRSIVINNTVTGGSTDVKTLVELVGGRSHPCPRTDAVFSNNVITDTRNDPPPEATAAVRIRCATHNTFTKNTVRSTGTTLGLYLRDESDYGIYTYNSFWTNNRPALWIAAGNVDKTFPSQNDFRNNIFRTDASNTLYMLGMGTGNHFTNNLVRTGTDFLGYIGGTFGNAWDHNTFYSAGTGAYSIYLGGDHLAGPPVDTYTNNIFSYSGDALFMYDGWVPGRYAGDRNLFWNRSGMLSFGTMGTLPSWRSAVGADTHSMNKDPQFIKTSSSNFGLTLGSPARGHGESSSDIGYNPALVYASLSQIKNPAAHITIVSPLRNALLRGGQMIRVRATDGQQVARVRFLIDGKLIGTDSVAPYQQLLDTRRLKNGTHVVTIQVVDKKGGVTNARQIFATKN